MGQAGGALSLELLIWRAYRNRSVLLLAPAHRTQTFMRSVAQLVMEFFLIFLLGAHFGKLMKNSGSVATIAG